MWFWCKFGATLYVSVLTIFTISNSVLKTRRDNQTKRVDEFIRQQASADCSASVLRTAKQSAKRHLERGEARKEYNFQLYVEYKKCSTSAGRFLLSLGWTEGQMKHTWRCMKNDASCRLWSVPFGTRKGTSVLRFIEAARLLLHTRLASASYLRSKCFIFPPSCLLFAVFML